MSMEQISQYKKIVGDESVCTDIRRYNKQMFDYIISLNLKKAQYILTNNIYESIVDAYQNLDEQKLLYEINEQFQHSQMVPVLNTSVFFICDYNINLIYETISS